MSYKMVKAIALGSVVVSTGIVHFNPDRKPKSAADERYHGGIFLAADAAKIERKRLGEIVRDASVEDYEQWQTTLRVGATVGQAGAQRVSDSAVESAAVDSVLTITHPPGTPAADASAGLFRDPDAAPGALAGPAGDEEAGLAEPSILDQSVAKLTEALEDVDDIGELQALRDAEQGGKSRAGAITAIEDRIAAVQGAGGE
jgi:hypothetical protein